MSTRYWIEGRHNFKDGDQVTFDLANLIVNAPSKIIEGVIEGESIQATVVVSVKMEDIPKEYRIYFGTDYSVEPNRLRRYILRTNVQHKEINHFDELIKQLRDELHI